MNLLPYATYISQNKTTGRFLEENYFEDKKQKYVVVVDGVWMYLYDFTIKGQN